jgi:hypothetical protein
MDVETIKMSSQCLKEILITPSGIEAFECLDQEVKDYLTPYLKKTKNKKDATTSPYLSTYAPHPAKPLDLDSGEFCLFGIRFDILS